jgi:catechol 2,3-dioxygenase-like lactoylglutathione lyase family enzyme
VSYEIQQIQHVSLPIPPEEQALREGRRFYGEIMGLREVDRPPSLPNSGLWFAIGDQELHLFGEPRGVAVNAESRRHPCFRVEDVAGLRRHLDEAGVHTLDDDGEIRGRPRFFAVDPFGNTLEFVRFEANHW